jgi:hypothetical protein
MCNNQDNQDLCSFSEVKAVCFAMMRVNCLLESSTSCINDWTCAASLEGKTFRGPKTYSMTGDYYLRQYSSAGTFAEFQNVRYWVISDRSDLHKL